MSEIVPDVASPYLNIRETPEWDQHFRAAISWGLNPSDAELHAWESTTRDYFGDV